MKAYNRKRKPKNSVPCKRKAINYDEAIKNIFKLNKAIKNFCDKDLDNLTITLDFKDVI